MKSFLKYLKYFLFLAIFTVLTLLIGILIISFRGDDIICCKLANYLSEFYYKKVSLSEKRHIMYMGESSEINDVVASDDSWLDQPWWYYRGSDEGIQGKGSEQSSEGRRPEQGIEERRPAQSIERRPVQNTEIRPGQNRENRYENIRRGDSIIDQSIEPRSRGTILPRTLFPRLEFIDYTKEAEELVQGRKECLKTLKSLIRFTNVTIRTEQPLPKDLDNFKIVEVPGKNFYIKRDVFYNGDREKVKLLIEKLREFHVKEHEFTHIGDNVEFRRSRALNYSNEELNKDLRWFLKSLNPYNPKFSLPSLLTFNSGHFVSIHSPTHSPTPSPLLSKPSIRSDYSHVTGEISVVNTIDQEQVEEQIENQEQIQKQIEEQKEKQEEIQERVQKQNQEQEQVQDKRMLVSNLIEQEQINKKVQDNSKRISISNLIEQEQKQNKVQYNNNKRVPIDSLIEQNSNKKMLISNVIDQGKIN